MFITIELKVFTIQVIALFACLPNLSDSLIITSVLAGDKKFKTISFDHKWLKPLTFEKEMPNTEFRRHRTVRPPKFDIDVNIPIKLPLEEEYPQEEYKKPVESNFFFQTGEIHEPNYQKQKYATSYGADQYAAASSNQDGQVASSQANGINLNLKDGFRGILPALAKSIKFQPQFITEPSQSNARSDQRELLQAVASNANQQFPIGQMSPQMSRQMAPPMARESSNQIWDRNYAPPPPKQDNYNQDPEFIPAGFVNLQLSGPTGGPKMTYEDIDKEHWAQQLSQTAGAMPYPILNYQQLQNFYGGLGTFTNGLAEHRYVQTGLLDKLKAGLNHFTNKFHFG